MTLEEQIAELTRAGSGTLWELAGPGFMLLAAALALAGAFTRNPVFFGIVPAAGLLAVAVRQTAPHIANAVRGLREGVKQPGAVEISFHSWKDAESNVHESCRGLISMDGRPLWEMEFVTPEHWQPREGNYPVQLVFIRGVEWPVVVLTQEGLLYPRLKPRKRQGQLQ
ncbi:MAG: hypothetical protein BWX45_00400 [Deltaproteobacteria bacterium ADurb.Bin002]|jgi:hypothetical protein|nr:MAG: hypothetical protein BWX45_00400 [Deltaproteobacteria bacterium ADurb.Bin002]HOH57235.1 hypothetical protein [Smithellaceae bacterium]HPV72121.1 hypothetical protein [Smithellaceae bacterium]